MADRWSSVRFKLIAGTPLLLARDGANKLVRRHYLGETALPFLPPAAVLIVVILLLQIAVLGVVIPDGAYRIRCLDAGLGICAPGHFNDTETAMVQLQVRPSPVLRWVCYMWAGAGVLGVDVGGCLRVCVVVLGHQCEGGRPVLRCSAATEC